MFFEDENKDYKMVAPDIDELIAYFDHIYMSPTKSTTTLLAAIDPIFEILKPLAPLKKNREVKEIWIRIPRGNIEDFGSFEEMRSCGQIETYEEYVQLWNREYPNEFCWYQLTVVRSLDQNGSLRFYGMALGNESIISASLEDRVFKREEYYAEGAAVRLCELIIPAVKDSMNLLLERKYNDFVQKELPYQFRYGVIKRCDIWETEQESKEETYGGLSEALVQRFIERIRSGVNDAERIGRIKDFTANDFFMACKLGYEAVGKDCNGYTLSDLYMRYADGRDEGLTGKGDGLNEGPGIDPDDPKAWNEWYLHREHYGCGHPWEVLGLMWLHVDYDESGYYFIVSGSHRQFEMVNFYIALSDAGIPVIIGGADELVASFEGKDYVGIVPHHMYTEHCEECFPEEYGEIIDFIYAYEGESGWFDKVIWLPEHLAEVQ